MKINVFDTFIPASVRVTEANMEGKSIFAYDNKCKVADAYADGYMTAWFMHWLNGDTEAGNVFFGKEAEILSNSNWQDVQKNN